LKNNFPLRRQRRKSNAGTNIAIDDTALKQKEKNQNLPVTRQGGHDFCAHAEDWAFLYLGRPTEHR